MAAQQPISLARNEAWIGRELDVLVESRQGVGAVGRSFRDAPEIDGQVLIRDCDAHPGTLVRARVIEAQPYDLTAATQPLS